MVNEPPKYYEPPEKVLRFLRWFCADSFHEEVEGDLWELYQEEVELHGLKSARRRFLFTALKYVNPYFFGKRQLSPNLENHRTMINHYFKISTRQLLKHKFFTLINIAGFAIGLAACLLILLFLNQETSYDQFHPKANQIYRLYHEGKKGERSGISPVVSTPVAESMLNEFPEIVNAARIAPRMYDAGENQIRRTDRKKNVFDEGFIYADPTFLEMFEYPILEGNLKSALKQPNSVVITERKAKQFFAEANPIGQTIILNDSEESIYKITGVLKDLPLNTHLKFDYLLSMEGLEVSKIPNWGFTNFTAYFELSPDADAAELEAKFPDFVQKYEREDILKMMEVGDNYFRYKLQSVQDIHLHSAGMMDFWSHGDITYVRLFAIIALFILLIAAINFMNLTTARSANRAKEVGLRKVLGSEKGQLIGQFLTESVIVSLISFILAILIANQFLPVFNQITGMEFTFPWRETWLLPSLFGVAFLIGILSGLYPAVYLSSFKPLKVLKGKLSSGSKGSRLRSSLVIIQFTASIGLIISSLVVWKQMDYIQNKKLGFEKEQVLIVEDSYMLGSHFDTFKSELKELPEVKNVSASAYLPVDGYRYNGCGTWLPGQDPETSEVGLAKFYVDHDYVETLGMNIVEGRDFNEEIRSDSQAILLNQRAVEMLGLENPVGKQVSSYTYLDSETGELLFETYTVVGVLEDFHFKSLKEEIYGLSLVVGNSRRTTMVKANSPDMMGLLSKVESKWKELLPSQGFRYHFLDEQFDKMYAFEARAGNIFALLTGLAIFIACLGLFALATYMAEQRSKEIGVRKVLGATTSDIVFLLTKNFALLVFISLLIAIPFAWYFMKDWLSDFAYQMEMSWGIFVIAGISALLIAVFSTGFQAMKAALANPVEAIRDE